MLVHGEPIGATAAPGSTGVAGLGEVAKTPGQPQGDGAEDGCRAENANQGEGDVLEQDLAPGFLKKAQVDAGFQATVGPFFQFDRNGEFAHLVGFDAMIRVGGGNALAVFVFHDQINQALQFLGADQRIAHCRVVALHHGRAECGLEQEADFGSP